MLGALIGAGASLLGGIMGNKSQEKANKANADAQREFAQNGVRWKVEDAKAAGVHPVYALGAPTHSFAPSYVGDSSLSSGISQAGQDIGRAVTSTMTQPERMSHFDVAMSNLSLERGQLENDLLRTQIRRQLMEGGPAFPSIGDGTLGFHGAEWNTNPATSPASDIENRYGDLVSALYGVGVIGSDLGHNMAATPTKKPTWRGQPDWHGQNKRSTLQQMGYELALEDIRRQLAN